MSISSPLTSNKWVALSATVALATTGALASSAEAATYTLDFDQGADGGSVLMNDNGTLNTTQWADWGLTAIKGINDRTGNAALFNTYDTTYNTSAGQTSNLRAGWLRDDDLRTGSNWGTEIQGNVLIIQEQDGGNNNTFNNNGYYNADDEAKGGYIDFDFAEAVSFNSFSMLDIDDNGGGIMVKGTKADGGTFDIDIDLLMAEHHAQNGEGDGVAQNTFVSMDGVTMTQLGTKQGNNSMFKFDIDEAYLTSVRFSYPGSGAISGLEWNTIEDGPQDIPEPSAIGGLLMLGFVGSRKYLKRKQAIGAETV